MIDIGTGTGLPLLEFLKGANAKRVLAIDINQSYVDRAKQRFANDKRVEVRFLDFMDADHEVTEKFDVVFFGFSFMLMPDKVKALKSAAKLLSPNGKIYLFLTLYDKPNPIGDFLKPKIKYLTSVDFGETMYVSDMPQIIKNADFEEVSKEKIEGNFLYKLFKIYRFEVKPNKA